MCYCNSLEYAWLHILITENNTEASDNATEDVIKRIKNVIREKANGKELIYKDYMNNCAEVLRDLKEAKDIRSTNDRIYGAFDELKQELIENEFAFDLWEDLKVNKAGKARIQRKGTGKKAESQGVAKALKEAGEGANIVSETVEASGIERLAQAFKVSLRRLYNFGIIDFDDTNACDAIVKNGRLSKSRSVQLASSRPAAVEKSCENSAEPPAF